MFMAVSIIFVRSLLVAFFYPRDDSPTSKVPTPIDEFTPATKRSNMPSLACVLGGVAACNAINRTSRKGHAGVHRRQHLSFWTTHIEHGIERKRPAIRPGVWWSSRLSAVNNMDTDRFGIAINRSPGFRLFIRLFCGLF